MSERKSAAPRVLLLTSSLGSGHWRAAQALVIALRETAPDATVELLDFWSLMDVDIAYALRQTYLWLVQQHPERYEQLYQLDEHTWRDLIDHRVPLPSALAAVMQQLAAQPADPAAPDGVVSGLDRWLFRLLCAVLTRRVHVPGVTNTNVGGRLAPILIGWGWLRMAWRLRARLRAFQPDVVVSTQMHPAALFSFVKTRQRLQIPALGVPTDFGMHDFWLRPGTDLYCVPHASVAPARVVNGKPPRLLATGIPLMPGFRDPPSQTEARLRLQIDLEGPLVLLLGGGLGLGVAETAERLLQALPELQLLVLCGHNASACATLEQLKARFAGRLRTHGWTEQSELFFRAADLVVGKPGGLTVAEALACGRPLLATSSLRGQESFNLCFLEQNGVGQLVAADELPAALNAWLADPAELARIQQCALALGLRDGARQIAAAALALAQTHRASVAPSTARERLRLWALRGMLRVDGLYQRWHRLQPIGEMLYVGCGRYRGPAMEFPDGSRIAPGDQVGTLHLNNARVLRLDGQSARHAAQHFSRLFLNSLRLLAERARHDPVFAQLVGFQAVSWFGSRGQQFGFCPQPLPASATKQLRKAYFRLIVWVFAPAAQTRAAARPEPTRYWISHAQLQRHFASDPPSDPQAPP